MMARCWTSFAATGRPDPNTATDATQHPAWTPSDESADVVYRFRLPEPDVFGGIVEQHHCNFWSDLRSAGGINF